jgi:hypothetical protein
VLRKTITLAVALLTGAGATLCAQEYSFRNFGDAEGLTNLAIRKIYQDRSGFLWVSTENGIFRYDGDRFEPFGIEHGVPENSSVAFGDAPDGSLLIGGNFGLYHLSGNRFEKVAVPRQSHGRKASNPMAKAIPFLAATPGCWNSIPSLEVPNLEVSNPEAPDFRSVPFHSPKGPPIRPLMRS